MRNWKFWEKQPDVVPVTPPAAEPVRRFTAKPRTDLAGVNTSLDPDKVAKLTKLRQRQEMILFDVEQATLATMEQNPWRERVALLDEAIATVRADREVAREEREATGQPVIPAPVTSLKVSEGPPPCVSFDVLGEHFHYEEEIDWAERGFQLARGDLQLILGRPKNLISSALEPQQREALAEHLTASLFVFASDMRDKAFDGAGLPTSVTVHDLAKPDDTSGGWFDWKGHSAAAVRKDHRLALLHQEELRLLDERERELQEQARWAERLPIARRRLADIEAEIAATEA